MSKPNILTLMMLLLTVVSSSAQQKYAGGDISMLPKYEEAGVDYYDTQGNRIADMLQFLKEDAGFNIARVRLFVNPTNETGVVQDIAYVKELGKRIKEKGMHLMLDFHYSDSWADPSNQWTPKAWKDLSDTELYNKIYDYTKDCLQQLCDAGATPDFIQTGNEISYGMLWGEQGTSNPKQCYSNSPESNWTRFVQLLTNAGKACREVCPEARIIIHSERSGDWENAQNMFDKLSGLDYDIIGLSYYPEWHNDIATLTTNLKKFKENYPDKPVMIVETGYYNNWYPEKAAYNFTSTYPASAAGQKRFLDDLVASIKDMEHVIGLLYWFPEENPHNNHVYEPWYNHGLFDPNTGKAVDALFSLKALLGSSSGISPLSADGQPASRAYTIDGRGVSSIDKAPRGLYVVGDKKVLK